jgi:uncharacterized glyoxalase superfamily protein PhnB
LYASAFKWVEVGPPDERAKIALVEPDPDAAPDVFEWEQAQIGRSTGIVFETKNINVLYDRLRDRGVRFPVPPQEMPWGGIMAVFEDLDGNRYQVVEDLDHYKREYD